MKVKIGNFEVSLVKKPDQDGKMRNWIHLDYHTNVWGILMYILLDGILWLTFFMAVMQ